MAAETSPPTAGPEEKSEVQASRVPRWWVVVAAAVVLAVVIIVYGYLAKPEPGWIGVADKDFWEWLKLLIVPAALAGGVAWLNWAQKKRELKAQDAQKERELRVADRHAEDAARQAYMDKMEKMLNELRQLSYRALRARQKAGRSQEQALYEYQVALRAYENENHELQRMIPKYKEWQTNPNPPPPDWEGHWVNPEYAQKLEEEHISKVKNLRDALAMEEGKVTEEAGNESAYESVKHTELMLEDKNTLIRAQTLTALGQVGERHKRSLMRLLHESQLIHVENPNPFSLDDADFSGADLTRMDLSNSDLKGARLIEVNLSGSRLFNANLEDADLTGSQLFDAVLPNANFTRATVKESQLDQCRSLEGATMPDGQILKGDTVPDGPTFQDWLKNKGRGEDGENNGPS